MIHALIALASGLVFGLGLAVSQMISPPKVLGFLDLAGDWDPSLAFVMLGAIPVAALGYRIARSRTAPYCASVFAEPTRSSVDARLAVGAVLFGIGWGLVGYCPGPAIASLGLGNPSTLLFVAAMLAGMAGYFGFQSLMGRRAKPAGAAPLRS